MKYVLYSKKNKAYYKYKNSWVKDISIANSYHLLNPLRFFLKFYLENVYCDKIIFKKIASITMSFASKNNFLSN